MQVITFEQLVSEERTRQVISAVLVGAASAANSYSASRSGYGSATVYTPRGPINATYYSPTAAAIANANASAQNDAMIANTIERGRQNLATLEQEVIKDNTLMPGEWYGGQLHFAPPITSDAGGPKTYRISITVGGETHDIEVTQGAGAAAG